MRPQIFALVPLLAAAAPSPSRESNPLWYDQGLYGAYPWRDYESFDLASPRVNVLEVSTQCDQGYVFLEPRGRSVSSPGPMILDAEGNLVWMEKKYGEAMDFRPQKYKGKDYLTFWAGVDDGTHGRGKYYMLDSSYEVQYTIEAANGLEGDLHEFQLTDEGTALMTVYEIIPADLSSVGGPSDGWIYDGLFQEIDIETGALLFQWRASDHYNVSESFGELKKHGRSETDAWDFFHINSVDKDPAGNYYISSRYMHTVTCITPTGAVAWKLGGAHSSFTDLSAAPNAASNFTWQHHVRFQSATSTLTIFDNGAYDNNNHLATPAGHSRALLVHLDIQNMTATLLASFVSPANILAHSQGSVQLLPNGHVFVGWGHSAAYTEYSWDNATDRREGAEAATQVLCDTHFGASSFFGWGWVKSYRAHKGWWVGLPSTRPDITVRGSRGWVSWNGATEVAAWRVQSSSNRTVLAQRGGEWDAQAEAADEGWTDGETVRKSGFESGFYLAGGAGGDYVRVVAVDSVGRALGVSEVVEVGSGRVMVDGDAFAPIEDRDVVALQLLLAVLAFMTVGLVAWMCWLPTASTRLEEERPRWKRLRL